MSYNVFQPRDDLKHVHAKEQAEKKYGKHQNNAKR